MIVNKRVITGYREEVYTESQIDEETGDFTEVKKIKKIPITEERYVEETDDNF